MGTLFSPVRPFGIKWFILFLSSLFYSLWEMSTDVCQNMQRYKPEVLFLETSLSAAEEDSDGVRTDGRYIHIYTGLVELC
jgi:hypothetical protein